MAKVKETGFIDIGLGYVEIGTNQEDEIRVEEVVGEFLEYFPALFEIALGHLLSCKHIRRPKPIDFRYLQSLAPRPSTIWNAYLDVLEHLMQCQAFIAADTHKPVNMLQEDALVMLLNLALAPELIGNDILHDRATKCRYLRTRGCKVCEANLVNRTRVDWPRRCAVRLGCKNWARGAIIVVLFHRRHCRVFCNVEKSSTGLARIENAAVAIMAQQFNVRASIVQRSQPTDEINRLTSESLWNRISCFGGGCVQLRHPAELGISNFFFS
ncbi:uncharacterized protein J3D65DRAFT_209652 [Phyllosticta citribraziliensis]|uniref:Uncharacterized protein n=1 Tax=Phyllosticta citribraziliensis TaxID=989973 RepID=A0ABR1M7R4_9PEZI